MYVQDLVRQQEFLKKKLSLLTEQRRQLITPTRVSISDRHSSHQNHNSEILLLQKEKLQTEQRLRQRSVDELARRVDSLREQRRVTRACVKGLRESLTLNKPRQLPIKISQNQIFYFYQIVQKSEKKLQGLRGREQALKAHINLILRKIQTADLKISKYRDRSLLAQSHFIRNILQQNIQKSYQGLNLRIDRERRAIQQLKRRLAEKYSLLGESQQRTQSICQRIQVVERQLIQSEQILQAYQRLLE